MNFWKNLLGFLEAFNKKGILLLNSKIEIKEIKNLPILIYKILNFLKLIN